MTKRPTPDHLLVEALALLLWRTCRPDSKAKGISHLTQFWQDSMRRQARGILLRAARCGIRIELETKL